MLFFLHRLSIENKFAQDKNYIKCFFPLTFRQTPNLFRFRSESFSLAKSNANIDSSCENLCEIFFIDN